MIIDFHTHIFPDAIARHAMEVMSSNSELPYRSVATEDSLLDTMDKCGVDKSVVCNVVTKESQHESVLRFAKSIDSERLISFGSVCMDSVYALEYVWKISDEGLKGIKLHPGMQCVSAVDERCFPVYDLIRALGLIAVFHVGAEYSTPGVVMAHPQDMALIAKEFPGIKIVSAHMGGLNMADYVLDNIAGKSDIYFDTSYAAASWMDKTTMTKIIKRHGAEKILLGSDFPWHLPSQEIDLINSLELSSSDKELILGGNAARLLEL